MQKNLSLISKYIKNIYKPTNNSLRTSSNTGNKNVDTSPRNKNDNQTGQFVNQRTVTVVGARETVRNQVVQQTGIQCFNCKEFGHFAKECRKPNVTFRIFRNANPLALVAATQKYPDTHYQASKPHKTYASSSKLTPSTKSHAPTRNKGKEIAKPITPPSESASEEYEDNDPEQAQRDKDMKKNLALIAKYIKNIYKPTNNNLRTSLNTKNKNVDTSPRNMNDNQTRQFGNQRTVTVVGARETVRNQETKRAKDYAYHKEKMMLCKQEEKGAPLSAEQGDWLDDTDDESDKHDLEAHYMYMAKIQEFLTA
ncbi:retrovirus-related pol polyprotein from transposon TNT 1-94 [Tanacetum coccineum]